MRTRGFAIVFLAIVSFPTCAVAANFEPKAADVCSQSNHNPKLNALDPRKVVGQLLEKTAGVTAIDLDATGNGVTFPENSKALLDPQGFCAGGKCSKKTQDALDDAFVKLLSFVAQHAKPASKAGDIDTRALVNQDGGALRKFLLGLPAPENACILEPPSPAPRPPVASRPPVLSQQNPTQTLPGSPNAPKPLLADVPHFFSLRRNIEDLPIPQDDGRFNGVKQASISWTDDYIARKSSFGIDLAAGYTVGRFAIDDQTFAQVTPFVTYNQQLVQAATVAQSSRAQNIGTGILGDITFPTGFGGSHDVQFYPKYVQSLSNRAEVFSGNFAYTPEYGISGIDSAYYIVPKVVSFLFTPRLKAVVNDVLTPGSNTALLKQGSYYWIGPQLNFALFGEGVLEGFGYNLSYEWYDVIQGKIPHVDLFSTSLTYDLGKSKLVSLQLKYDCGRNLDTLEKINQITLGLGAKY